MPQGKYQIQQDPLPTQGQFKIPQTASEAIQQIQPKEIDAAASLVPTGRTLAGTAAGIGTAILTKSPIVGSAAAAATDTLLDPEVSSKSLGENALDFAKSFAINEISGRLLGGIFRAGQEYVKSGSVEFMPNVRKAMDSGLKPTLGQASGSKITNLIENVFAGSAKDAALVKSGALTEEQANLLVQNISKRNNIVTGKPFNQTTNIVKDFDAAKAGSFQESNLRGNNAIAIASANTHTYPDVNGKIGTVQGPIYPTNLVANAKALQASLARSPIPPDPNGPLAKTLDRIITEGTKTDANGTPIPWQFKDAWEAKKSLYGAAYGDTAYGKSYVPDFQDGRFAKLADSLNKDIEASMPTWGSQGNVALQNFKEAKQIVEKRIELFKPVEKLINSESGIAPAIDKLLNDPADLRKAVLTSKLQIPSGQGFTYISNNTRKDLAAYEITQIFNRAKAIDKSGNVFFDGNKLVSQILDPDKQESYRLLFGSPKNPQSVRSNLEQVLKAAALVSPSGSTGMGRFQLMRLTGAGLNMAGSMLGDLGSISPFNASIVSGTVGLNAVGKLMTNPTTARIVTAALSGGALNMPSQIAGRAVANVLRNEDLTLDDSQGKQISGKFASDGSGFALKVGDGEIKK